MSEIVYTHELPPHLGGWPCRPLGSAANNELGQMLTLVEYAVQAPEQPRTFRIFVDRHELTEVEPPKPEPPSGSAVAANYSVWLRGHGGWFDGFEPDVGREFLTWQQLNTRHPEVQVLVYDPVASAPELPWQLPVSGSSARIHHDGDLPGRICIDIPDGDYSPTEAAEIAGVLLRAAAVPVGGLDRPNTNPKETP